MAGYKAYKVKWYRGSVKKSEFTYVCPQVDRVISYIAPVTPYTNFQGAALTASGGSFAFYRPLINYGTNDGTYTKACWANSGANYIDISDLANNDIWDFGDGYQLKWTSVNPNSAFFEFHYYYNGNDVGSGQIFGSPNRAVYYSNQGKYISAGGALPWYSEPVGKCVQWMTQEANSVTPVGDLTHPVTDSYYNGGNMQFFSVTDNVKNWWLGIPVFDMEEPYPDINPSTPSGPAAADGIPENDPVDIPDLPSVSVSDTGFVSLFNPTLLQVKDLADYMWTGLFDVDTYRKLFADPMDCLLGFNMLPVAIPHGTAVPVRVGNISTGISMNPATSQWVEVDCGSINVGDAFGSYLSYSPYTKFSLHLPYIGTVELSTDDVVGKTLSLKYHVDVLSCACVAYLKCGDSVLYEFTGSCGYSIPISGNDFRSTIANIVSIAATIGGAVISGGAAAPIAGTGAKAVAKRARQKAAQSVEAIGDAASISKNVMSLKPEVHRSGAIGGSAGMMGIQTPYLIVEYPNPCKPKSQYKYTGYPSFVTVKLNDISGYAEFENIIVENIPCTEEEMVMIKDLCKGGIHL